jgi:hypothetical protein
MPNNIILINEANFHDHVIDFINQRHMEVNDYEDMKRVYVKMLESNYFFVFNHELKIHMLIDLTYSLSQIQENRENVLECLDIHDQDSDSDDETISIIND